MFGIVEKEELEMNEKLKPCPFCGGEASFMRYGVSGLYGVGCESCSINFDGGQSKIYAKQRWNTRANCQKILDSSNGDKTSPVEELERIDPKVTPLTPDDVGRVVLVDNLGNHELMVAYRPGREYAVEGGASYRANGMYDSNKEYSIDYYYRLDKGGK